MNLLGKALTLTAIAVALAAVWAAQLHGFGITGP